MRSVFSYALVGLTLFAGVAAATADIAPEVGDKLYFSGYVNGQYGGSVVANPAAGADFTPFRTFCVEIDQYIYVNGGTNYLYKISGIGTTTVSGGKTLTPKAAWLYTQYRHGSLNSYNDTKSLDRNVLQYAIWNAMGYTDAQLISQFGSSFATIIASKGSRPWETDYSSSGWTGIGDVRIANLVWGNTHQGHCAGYQAQDQLCMQRSVPVPAAAVLGAIGVGLVGMVKRRLS